MIVRAHDGVAVVPCSGGPVTVPALAAAALVFALAGAATVHAGGGHAEAVRFGGGASGGLIHTGGMASGDGWSRWPLLGVAVHLPNNEVPLSSLASLPAGFASYRIFLEQPMDRATIRGDLAQYLAANIRPVIKLAATDPVSMATVGEALDHVAFLGDFIFGWTVGNEIPDLATLITYLAYVEDVHAAIHAHSAWQYPKMAATGIADGLLSLGQSGNPTADAMVDAIVAASGEYLEVHHHSSLAQLILNLAYLRGKTSKEIRVMEGGYPDPLAEGVVNNEAAIDALVAANYTAFGLSVLALPDVYVWVHSSFRDSGTGDRYDHKGLYQREDGSAKPARAEFIALEALVSAPAATDSPVVGDQNGVLRVTPAPNRLISRWRRDFPGGWDFSANPAWRFSHRWAEATDWVATVGLTITDGAGNSATGISATVHNPGILAWGFTEYVNLAGLGVDLEDIVRIEFQLTSVTPGTGGPPDVWVDAIRTTNGNLGCGRVRRVGGTL